MKAFLNPFTLAILSAAVDAVSVSEEDPLVASEGIVSFIVEDCIELVEDIF